MPAKKPNAVSAQKLALTASVGVMPRVNVPLTPAEMKQMYFSTTAADTFHEKEIPESLSFADIHNIGKKDTKYFKYRPSTAPFWQRTMCPYTQEYIARPLDGVIINRELAETFQPPKEVPPKAPFFVKQTKYKDDYNPYPGARPPKSMKPSNPMHVDPTSHLLETECATHRLYPVPPGKLVHPSEEEFRPSRFDVRVQHPTIAKTRYTEDYDEMEPLPAERKFRIEDNSSRTMGAVIPARVKDMVYKQTGGDWDQNVFDNLKPMREILRQVHQADNYRVPAWKQGQSPGPPSARSSSSRAMSQPSHQSGPRERRGMPGGPIERARSMGQLPQAPRPKQAGGP
jgi:hypothetical protein